MKLALLFAAAFAAFTQTASAQAASSAGAAPMVRAAIATADDSAARAVSVTGSGAFVLSREVFRYASEGRRDPFGSLLASGELRPMLSDLKLVAVAYDPRGNSVAIMRDVGTNEQYRARTGQTLGRMRVASIGPKQVVFTIEEFGFSRQETLALGDSTSARTQQ